MALPGRRGDGFAQSMQHGAPRARSRASCGAGAALVAIVPLEVLVLREPMHRFGQRAADALAGRVQLEREVEEGVEGVGLGTARHAADLALEMALEPALDDGVLA